MGEGPSVRALCSSTHNRRLEVGSAGCGPTAPYWDSGYHPPGILCFLIEESAVQGNMFSGMSPGPLSVYSSSALTRTCISREAISLYGKISMKLAWRIIFSIWVGIAEKVFKVRGQRSRSRADRTP